MDLARRDRRQSVALAGRSEEHTSELRHLVISYAVFCLKKKKKKNITGLNPLADELMSHTSDSPAHWILCRALQDEVSHWTIRVIYYVSLQSSSVATIRL